jgi:hypothetical protein
MPPPTDLCRQVGVNENLYHLVGVSPRFALTGKAPVSKMATPKALAVIHLAVDIEIESGQADRATGSARSN